MDNQTIYPLPCSSLNDVGNITVAYAVAWHVSGISPLEVAQNLVEKCPNVCSAIYGSGNPDISGIGVFISLMVQAVYWILFRPLLAALFLLLPPAKQIKSQSFKSFLKRLKNLSEAVHGTSIFLNFTTLVAGVVRIKQSPPEYEALYLNRLAQYIFNMSSVAYLQSVAFSIGPITSSKDSFYNLVEFINTLLSRYLTDKAAKYRNGLIVVRLIAAECAQEHAYPTAMQAPTSPPWYLYMACLSLAPFFGVYLAWKFGDAVYKLLQRKGFSVFVWLFNNRRVRVVFFISFMAIDIAGTVDGMLVLNATRRGMQVANPPAFQDNQWGFGQVTAIMIWVPMTLWLIRSLLAAIPWFDIVVFLIIKITQYEQKRKPDGYDDDAPWWIGPAVIAWTLLTMHYTLDELDPGVPKEVERKKKDEKKASADEEQSSTSMAGALPPPNQPTLPSRAHTPPLVQSRVAQSLELPRNMPVHPIEAAHLSRQRRTSV